MLKPGDPLIYWQVTDLVEARYDVPDAPMQGEMDSTFFLTKDKNVIPHTYPCRTAYIGEMRDKEPMPGSNPTGTRPATFCLSGLLFWIFLASGSGRRGSAAGPALPSTLKPPARQNCVSASAARPNCLPMARPPAGCRRQVAMP